MAVGLDAAADIQEPARGQRQDPREVPPDAGGGGIQDVAQHHEGALGPGPHGGEWAGTELFRRGTQEVPPGQVKGPRWLRHNPDYRSLGTG